MAPLRVLVTGPPGVGKTTLCEKVAKALAAGSTTGFICAERRDDSGKREAFDLVALDGSDRGVLADAQGPETGEKVGKYHVQVAALERFSFPILDAALAGGGSASAGGRPRAFVFDEIGNMELKSSGFVERVRRLLTSEDKDLHVLGTVALNGRGLISAAKTLPGVEVVEIDRASRDAAADEVTQRFAAALGGAESSSASASSPRAKAAPSAAAAAAAPVYMEKPRVRFDKPEPGQFSAVYLDKPDGNFASLNAGDYLLYVGGAAINKAFFDALARCGHGPRHRYEALHQALLERAAAAPGELQWLDAGSVDPWALDDSLAFCGLLPEAPRLAPLSPVGLVSVAVFPEGRRPCGAERNVAMVYTVGPNCGKVRKKGRREVDNMSKEAFLEVIEGVGAAITSAVCQYNEAAAASSGSSGSGASPQQPPAAVRRVDPTDGKPLTLEECERQYKGKYRPTEIRDYWHHSCRPVASSRAPGADAPLPQIDVLRICLLSGGVYKHPAASKVDVASALVRGLVTVPGRPGAERMPVLDFAFDEDCFQTAWRELGFDSASS